MAKNNNIRCAVDSCHYWGNGGYCEAEQILIATDKIASESPHTLNALQASSVDRVAVSHCEETCCKTFIAKGKPEAYQEGIGKLK